MDIFRAISFSSVLRFTISFLKAMKLSTAVIWSTIFLCRGFWLALVHASRNWSYVTPNSAISSLSKSSTIFLNALCIDVYSSRFSSSVSKTRQFSSRKDIIGVFHRGLLKKLMMMSKNQSYTCGVGG